MNSEASYQARECLRRTHASPSLETLKAIFWRWIRATGERFGTRAQARTSRGRRLLTNSTVASTCLSAVAEYCSRGRFHRLKESSGVDHRYPPELNSNPDLYGGFGFSDFKLAACAGRREGSWICRSRRGGRRQIDPPGVVVIEPDLAREDHPGAATLA